MKDYLEAYLREKPFFFSLLRPKEAELYQKFKPFKKPVLDLGCGDGFFAKVAFGKIDVGIDPDKKSVEEAEKRNVYHKVKIYDGRKIPYPDNYFTTIVCNSTFEHIPNITKVLSEVCRVLKAGGMLYFTVPTNTWSEYLFGKKLLGKLYTRFFIRRSKHYNLYTLSGWEKKLARLGLQIVWNTHYLNNRKTMWWFDITHYLSASSLITKRLFGRWVLFPQKVKFLGFFEILL